MQKILILDAYDAPSHRYWRESLVSKLSEYDWTSLVLPPRFFRWRIRGNPLSWYEDPALKGEYDLIVATSMVDLASIRGMHRNLNGCPSIVYFHENQFSYPESEHVKQENPGKLVNLYSALAADKILFNSEHNKETFLAGANSFVANMPDHNPEGLEVSMESKSEVCPVGINDDLFKATVNKSRGLKLLWNHRWEYDKGPERLYLLMKELRRRGLEFSINIIGESFRTRPDAFGQIETEFAENIEEFGYVQSRGAYERVLAESNYVISTSLHDFQGVSILEAVALGCTPILPNRLAYPGYFSKKFLYDSFLDDPKREVLSMVDLLIKTEESNACPCIDLTQLSWEVVLKQYRDIFSRLSAKSGHNESL